jgi:hypothetical protein
VEEPILPQQKEMAHHNHDRLDKALVTRNTCVAGLCASWITGVAGVAGGIYCIYLKDTADNPIDGGATFVIPHAAKEVLPLGLNVIVTLLNESMGVCWISFLISATFEDLNSQIRIRSRMCSHKLRIESSALEISSCPSY